MRPFSLEEYLKNHNRKVVTRDGKPVKILFTNLISDKPVVAQIEGTEYSLLCTKDGKCSFCQDSINDLFFKSEKHEGWINVYSGSYFSTSARIFSSEEEAKKEGEKWKDYVTTIKIEWET